MKLNVMAGQLIQNLFSLYVLFCYLVCGFLITTSAVPGNFVIKTFDDLNIKRIFLRKKKIFYH